MVWKACLEEVVLLGCLDLASGKLVGGSELVPEAVQKNKIVSPCQAAESGITVKYPDQLGLVKNREMVFRDP
jgi:hypothetical protein